MNIRLIAAMSDKNKGVGFKNTIPWKQKDDMDKFKRLSTTDGIIIMGSNTFRSFNGYILPNRIHIVLTRTLTPSSDERVIYVQSMEDAIQKGKELVALGKGKGISIIGGVSVWKEGVAHANLMHLGYIDTDAAVEFDTFFPDIDMSEWREVARASFLKNENNSFDSVLVDYERIQS